MWTARCAASPHGQVYPIGGREGEGRSLGWHSIRVSLWRQGRSCICSASWASRRRDIEEPVRAIVFPSGLARHAQPNLTAAYMLTDAEPCIDLERHM